MKSTPCVMIFKMLPIGALSLLFTAIIGFLARLVSFLWAAILGPRLVSALPASNESSLFLCLSRLPPGSQGHPLLLHLTPIPLCTLLLCTGFLNPVIYSIALLADFLCSLTTAAGLNESQAPWGTNFVFLFFFISFSAYTISFRTQMR